MIEYNKKSYFFLKYINLADIVSLEIYLVASAPLQMNKKKKNLDEQQSLYKPYPRWIEKNISTLKYF